MNEDEIIIALTTKEARRALLAMENFYEARDDWKTDLQSAIEKLKEALKE